MAHFVYPAASPAQPTAAYPAAQAAYVAAAPQAAYATATPRAGLAYEAYPAAHATPQYAYATRTQPAVTYDQTKTYYQPAQATAYTAAETHYQAAKPVYSTGTAYNTTQRQAAQPKAQSLQVTTSGTTYVYGTATAPAVTTYPQTNYTATTTTQAAGYETALYTAATSYYQQQQAAKVTGAQWIAKKTGGPFKPKPKGPPKQPQLHYCDVCKISCAGPQTYREHLEGQKHKKKEQATKGAAAPPARGGHNQLRCELCDVTCTGADAYAAHIRGAKHTKVMKLHAKLGKPIPSTDPVIVANASSTTTTTAKVSSGTTVTSAKTVKTSNVSGIKKVLTTPKITFVGGTQLKTTGPKAEEIKVLPMKTDTAPASITVTSVEKAMSEDGEKYNILGEKDVAPVGHEYIEEVKNELGKVVSFNCKLCECKFNDPNAKEMHLKGRRHRLQYKKKVDPNLLVEVKPSIRARKVQEEKLRRQVQKEEFWQRRLKEERWRDEMRMEEEMYWEHQRRYEMMEYFEWHRMGGPPGMMPPRFPGPMGPGPMMRRPDTSDDRHVMAKHTSIYPTEAELQAVQAIVSSCERGLKLVSDFLADSDAPKSNESVKKPEPIKKDFKSKVALKVEPKKQDVKKDTKEDDKKKEEDTPAPRVLKGVMRVGVLAKGLLLHGDLNVHLVVLCSEKPTRTMLERVADALGKQLATSEDKYEIKRCVEEAAIIVSSEKEPMTSCIITLTSPVMRDSADKEGGRILCKASFWWGFLAYGQTPYQPVTLRHCVIETVSVKDPPDVLDRQKCLDALAALRHAKWFQARANGLPSCVIVIRILRDLCQRVPTWTPLQEWAMELLSEKCVSSGGGLGPGDSLRRTFECIASGILLPGGPGLYDPCEKDPTDAASSLSNQQREEITASAQHALRLIAFRQIHKVLGMDPLPPPRFQRQRFNPRKRRRTTSAGGDGDGDVAGEKKDKKDDESMDMEN